MTRRESSIEAACKRYADRRGWVLLKLWPISRGLPDRILLRPGAKIDFIEFKRPGGVPTAMQLWWRDRLLSLGFGWTVVDSVEKFKLEYGHTD